MYIKFLPSEYVLLYKKGKLVKEGKGLSFFCFEKRTSAYSIPVSNIDSDFIYTETTGDYQSVTVQGQLTYRVYDYKKTAESTDFTVNLKTKKYNDTPLVKLSKRIINISEVVVKSIVASLSLKEAVQHAQGIADGVLREMKENEELNDLGISIIGFSVLNVSAKTETVSALEAKTREDILRQADDALYERRNASIEQERRVKENELNTEISVEEKKKKIRETEISTKRMILEKENEFERIKIESEVQRKKIKIEADIELEKKEKELAELKFENAKKEADADAYRISAIMEAYNKLDRDVLVALATLNMEPERLIARAFDKLADGEGKIGTLNISPEILESLRAGVKK